MVSLKSIQENHSHRIVPVLKSAMYSAASFEMGRQCCLIARNCMIEGSRLSLSILNQNLPESANKALMSVCLGISSCTPQIWPLAARIIAGSACVALAHQAYKQAISKPLPLPPGK